MNTCLSLESFAGEVWQDIPEWEGYYAVSNFCRIKSIERIVDGGKYGNQLVKAKIKKQWLLSGYPAVTLNRGKYKTNITCHVLAARAFLPNPLNKPHVNHIDANKLNCSLSNLEWCTPSENVLHAIKMGNVKIGVDKCNSKLTKVDVMDILSSKETSGVISKKYGVSKTAIKGIRSGNTYSNITGINKFVNPYLTHDFKLSKTFISRNTVEYYKVFVEKLEGEKWAWIPNYEGSYKISNYGRINSFSKTKSGRILKQKVNKYGYLQVCLMVDTIKRYATVHVLMAETFLSKQIGDLVNHKNGNKKDNSIVNLEVCNNHYNIAHSKRLKQLIA